MGGDDLRKRALVESLIFASRGLDVGTLVEITGLDDGEVRSILSALMEDYRSDAHGIELKEIDGYYRFYTKPDYAKYVSKVARRRNLGALSPAQLEIVVFLAARRQATKLEIDSMRGKDCAAILKQLLSSGVVRRRKVGRGYVYSLTETFREESMIDELLRQTGASNFDQLFAPIEPDEASEEQPTIEDSTTLRTNVESETLGD